MDQATWKKKKARLQEQQEAFSGKLLRRSYITKQGKNIVEHEAWPAGGATLQRIANFMDPEKRYTPEKVMRKLNGGDKLTTRFGAVYSLITLNSR